jgi:hypothetical protein
MDKARTFTCKRKHMTLMIFYKLVGLSVYYSIFSKIYTKRNLQHVSPATGFAIQNTVWVSKASVVDTDIHPSVLGING